jgi:sugar (pentulose or hexulose) kinase
MTEQGPLILTFDIGTQSARALLVGTDGGIAAKAQKVFERPYYSLRPGWAEQKADFYWDAVCETSLALKQKAPEDWGRVIAVTCTTIRDTALCLDKDNNPLRDAILWLDQRETADEDMGPIPAAGRLAFRMVRKLETVELQRRMSACNWIIKYEPEIWAKTHKFVFLPAWLTAKLSGRLVDSIANMVGHVPFDVKIRTWMKKSDLRRCIFLLEDDKLPELVEPGAKVGAITREAAERTGIPEGTPFIATGPDKGCETLGLSCTGPERAALSFGTTATVEITTDKYIEALPLIPPYPAVLVGAYNPEVEIFRGYWLISWFKKEFCAKELEEAKRLNVSAEELLNERLHDIPPGCEGLILQPYFTPGADMPHARGAMIGFSDVHTRIHIYRAIVEGINFSLIEGLRAIEKQSKLKVKQLYVAGGGSQSREICQITANMFGLPLYRTQTHEVSGMGSALIGFVAMDMFSSYAEAVESMVHVRDEFLPDMEEHKIYDALYEHAYCKVFERLAPLYKEIDAIHGKTDRERS